MKTEMPKTKIEKLPAFRYEGWVQVNEIRNGREVTFQQRVGAIVLHRETEETLRFRLEEKGVMVTSVFPCLGEYQFMKPTKSRKEV